MATLNSAADVRSEGAWDRALWADRITSDSDFNTFLGGILTQANDELQLRVGPAWYALVVTSNVINFALYLGILTQAEMHLAQARICLAAATIVDTGGAPNAVPLGAGPAAPSPAELRATAGEHVTWAADLIELTRSTTRTGGHVPTALAVATSPAIISRFDPVVGDTTNSPVSGGGP